MIAARTAAIILASGALACGGPAPPAPHPAAASASDTAGLAEALEVWSDAWLAREAERYLDDAGFRRAMLEASLTNPDNIYSSTRLSSYGHGDRGWDTLPEWTPTVARVDAAMVAGLIAGDPVTLREAAPLWDGARPSTQAGWVELGRRTFFSYPLRPEVFAEHALRNPAVARAVGLAADGEGSWPGVVAFADVDGKAKIGITCALCHVSIEDGQMIEGRARRVLDYGQMRLAYHRDTGAPLPDELAQRMASWGRGRADITQDDDEDPVAIVDLWGVRGHSHLTQAATLKHVHPAALAIRQETQILHANRERTRPPRALAWAMAMYVYSLRPPAPARKANEASVRGERLFGRHCARCHTDENFGGSPIDAHAIGTDATLAFGRARGTGVYRPSPLVRVAAAAPYFHHGAAPTLKSVLDPDRLREVPGHSYGTSLPERDRDAIVAFLYTL